MTLIVNAAECTIDRPVVSYKGVCFYRHIIHSHPPATTISIEARHMIHGWRAKTITSTLSTSSHSPAYRIGLLADLHLPEYKRTISQYRPGTKRLSGLAYELGVRYIRRLEALGADCIVFTGDVVDPCTKEILRLLQQIVYSVSIPCYPIIGNHEPWSPDGESLFYRELGLPDGGYYTVRKDGLTLIMLSTPYPDALHNGSQQYHWLEQELKNTPVHDDIVLFSHFSLHLHPCVQGWKNDGYQLLDNHTSVCTLLEKYSNVRLFVAGHKNIPSVIRKNNIIHLLSPQLIQAPCGYDILTLYPDGVSRTTYEIDEQHYCEVARTAYEHKWDERYGDECGRNFYLPYSV